MCGFFARRSTSSLWGWNGIVRIWRLENGRWEVEQALRGHSDAVSSVKFSLDGVHLASGSGDRAVKLWRLEEGGRWEVEQTFEGHSDVVEIVNFSPDGAYLVSGGGIRQ